MAEHTALDETTRERCRACEAFLSPPHNHTPGVTRALFRSDCELPQDTFTRATLAEGQPSSHTTQRAHQPPCTLGNVMFDPVFVFGVIPSYSDDSHFVRGMSWEVVLGVICPAVKRQVPQLWLSWMVKGVGPQCMMVLRVGAKWDSEPPKYERGHRVHATTLSQMTLAFKNSI